MNTKSVSEFQDNITSILRSLSSRSWLIRRMRLLRSLRRSMALIRLLKETWLRWRCLILLCQLTSSWKWLKVVALQQTPQHKQVAQLLVSLVCPVKFLHPECNDNSPSTLSSVAQLLKLSSPLNTVAKVKIHLLCHHLSDTACIKKTWIHSKAFQI